jgi:hypothetical protein
MRTVLKKNERRLTNVRQSKFFFKVLENTIFFNSLDKIKDHFRLFRK